MNFELYICDTETTGLDYVDNSPIEISIIRFKTGEQKTWHLKALNEDKINLGSLKVNGHKLEDITHQTKAGKDKYLDPKIVIIDIENWLMEDNLSAEERIICGHNIDFDKNMLRFLWKKLDSVDSFPFGRRSLDTFQLEFFLDYVNKSIKDSYSLSALLKNYGIKNEKAHSAEADTKATSKLIEKQFLKYENNLQSK
jgi:DNA polymerase III alpha subunit (gram-positive type)